VLCPVVSRLSLSDVQFCGIDRTVESKSTPTCQRSTAQARTRRYQNEKKKTNQRQNYKYESRWHQQQHQSPRQRRSVTHLRRRFDEEEVDRLCTRATKTTTRRGKACVKTSTHCATLIIQKRCCSIAMASSAKQKETDTESRSTKHLKKTGSTTSGELNYTASF